MTAFRDEVLLLGEQCDSCEKHFSVSARRVVIWRFPDGGADTVCLECHDAMVRTSVAWFYYEGQLPPESFDDRFKRARDVSNSVRARKTLEGLINEN